MIKKLLLGVIVVSVSLVLVLGVLAQDDGPICQQLNSDGTWFLFDCPTPTPQETLEPTVVPTVTSWPTPTQEDTRTPKPPTPTMLPTNTQTPVPTATPDGGCLVQNKNTFGVWVRTLPVVREDTNTLDAVLPQQYIRPEAIYYGPDWTWFSHWWDLADVIGDDPIYVWSAVESTDDPPDILLTVLYGCDDLPVVTDPFPTPVRRIMQGAHIIGSDAANMLLGFCNQMDTVKLFQSVVHYADDFRACNPDIWIVCRYWTDNIAEETDYDAELAYQRIGRSFPNECDAVEPENEKAPQDDADWPRWTQFNKDFAALMAYHRNMQSCAYGLGPGWPEFDRLVYLVPYFRWVDENPLADGRYHCISSHAAMYAPWSRSDMPWVNDPYIAGRVYMIRDWVYANTPDNFDLYEWKGVWAITEVGLSDGYSGNWSAPYTCDELAQAFWTTHDTYVANGFPHAQHHWSFGVGGIWTDDSPCAGQTWG